MAWNDHAFLTYFAVTLASGVGFVLFLEWWIRTGKASAVYIYVTTLMGGICIAHLGLMYARNGLLNNDLSYDNHWWWAYRTYPILISVLEIVFHMAYRRFNGKGNKL